MRKIQSFLISLSITIATANAQNLPANIPNSATAIMRYSADMFSKEMPVEKLESYPFVKEKLFKALKLDTLKSLAATGIDFGKDIYQYSFTEDSVFNFLTRFALKDKSKFLQLLDANYDAEMQPQKKDGFELLSLSANTYTGWNDTHAVFVITAYNNPNHYFADYGTTISDSTVMNSELLFDTAVSQTEPVIPEIDNKVKEDKKKPAGKSNKKKTNTKKRAGRSQENKAVPVPESEIAVEGVPMEDALISKAESSDSSWEEKHDAWQKIQDRYTKARQEKAAALALQTAFNLKTTRYDYSVTYNKLIDPAAHASVWLDYDNLMQQYWLNTYTAMPYLLGFGKSAVVPGKSEASFKAGVNIFFEKDKMRVEQKSYSPIPEMSKLGKQLFKSKQSASLAGFINPDHLGYFSMSINSEAMAHYYYRTAKQYLSNYIGMGAYADIINLYVDFLEIMIDEKAMSELMPGNCIFVLHDMGTKQISYTDYIYDDDFKSSEIKKTRQELSPDFSFVIETEREDFMQKLIRLPVKYAREGRYQYEDRGKYFELILDSGNNVFGRMYFAVDRGRCIITTSKPVLDMTLAGREYELSGDTKKLVSKNNYALEFHTKKLLDKISAELTTAAYRKVNDYLKENLGDVQMKTSYQNGLIQSSTTMAITGEHANSLQFFFNVFEQINSIMVKDKNADELKFN